jgi:hypothetical protein
MHVPLQTIFLTVESPKYDAKNFEVLLDAGEVAGTPASKHRVGRSSTPLRSVRRRFGHFRQRRGGFCILANSAYGVQSSQEVVQVDEDVLHYLFSVVSLYHYYRPFLRCAVNRRHYLQLLIDYILADNQSGVGCILSGWPV